MTTERWTGSLVALGALALSNLALVSWDSCSWFGLEGQWEGRRGGLLARWVERALFEDPGTSAAVMGTLMMVLAVFGLVVAVQENKLLMAYHVLALFMLIGIIYACAVMNIYKESSADR